MIILVVLIRFFIDVAILLLRRPVRVVTAGENKVLSRAAMAAEDEGDLEVAEECPMTSWVALRRLLCMWGEIYFNACGCVSV